MAADGTLVDGVLYVQDHVKLNVKQEQFGRLANDPAVEELLFTGSIRAGKSQACARQTVKWAWKHPGTKHLCVRRTYRQLEDSTLQIFLKGDGSMGPALPRGLLRGGSMKDGWRAKDYVAYLANGSEILFRSAENPREAMENIRNVTLASVFVDQIEEFEDDIEEELYETWLSRLSDPRGPRKLIAAANPGAESHWVYERFLHPEKKLPRVAAINVTIYDNAENLPPDYIRKQEERGKRDPLWFDRFCLGKWGAFGGKRFKTWNPERHVIDEFVVPRHWEIVHAQDYGWAHNAVAEWLAIDPEGRYYGIAEDVKHESSVRKIAAGIREVEQERNIPPSSRWLDPSCWASRQGDPSIAEQFDDVGMDFGKADNDRIGGWNRIDDLLTEEVPGDERAGDVPNPDGTMPMVPRLRFFRCCKLVIHQLPNAKIKDGTDDIEKKNDDALDSFRYGVNSRPPLPFYPEDEEELDPREAYAREMIARKTGEQQEQFAY